MSTTPVRGRRRGAREEFSVEQCIGDRYELEAPLASGAQAEVWRARDLTDGRPVVLKFFTALEGAEATEQCWSAFKTELAALQRIVSPYVLQPLDQGLHQKRRPFLVTAYIEGSDLVAWAAGRATAPRGWAVLRTMFQNICLGLQAAHGLGITHGDLAPRNVRARSDGDAPVVLDFGMGALRQQEVFSVRLHDDHSAPELMSAPLAPTLDVFALGVLFVELYVDARVGPGGTPWREVSARGEAALREALAAVMPSDSPFVDALVAALHADRARRPQDAYNFFASLERAVGETTLGDAVWPERAELRGRIGVLSAEVGELRDELAELNALIDRYQTEYTYRVGQYVLSYNLWVARNACASRGERVALDDERFNRPTKAREAVKSDVHWDRRRREAALLMHEDRYPNCNEDERQALTSLLGRANAAIDVKDEAAWEAVAREYARWRDTRAKPGETSGEEIARLRRMLRDLEYERVESMREVERVRASAEYREALAWQDTEARGVDYFAAAEAEWKMRLAGAKNTWQRYVRSGLGG